MKIYYHYIVFSVILRYSFSLSDLHFSLIFLEGEVTNSLLSAVRAQLEPCSEALIIHFSYSKTGGPNFTCLVNFHEFVICQFISNLIFSKKFFSDTTRVSNGLDPDLDRYFISPDLGPIVCKG